MLIRWRPWATVRLKVISKATGLASMSPACQCFCSMTISLHHAKLKRRNAASITYRPRHMTPGTTNNPADKSICKTDHNRHPHWIRENLRLEETRIIQYNFRLNWFDVTLVSFLNFPLQIPKWFSGFYGQSRTIITTPVVLRFFCMDFNFILVYTFKCNFLLTP